MMSPSEADTVDVSVWGRDGHFGSSDGGWFGTSDAQLRGEATDRRGGIGSGRIGRGGGAAARGERQPAVWLEQCREPALLLPVSITPAGAPARRRARASVRTAAPVPMRDAASDIEIELPGSVRVRVRGRVDRQALREVLVALGVR
jgi:hypothetical protein